MGYTVGGRMLDGMGGSGLGEDLRLDGRFGIVGHRM